MRTHRILAAAAVGALLAAPLTVHGAEGRGQVGANQSGEIQVDSDLLGCSAKNPLTPTPSHFC